MGQITSKAEPFGSLQEGFMIRYLSMQGPTQYSMELIPNGIGGSDSARVAREKFKIARKGQRQLARALRKVEGKAAPHRCLSPFMLEDFEVSEDQKGHGKKQNVYNYAWHEESQQHSPKDHVKPLTREQVESLGSLGRLVTPLRALHGSEEIMSVDMNQKSMQRKRLMRSRSRPEPSARRVTGPSRQAKSYSTIQEGLTVIEESSSEVTIEEIEKLKRTWPTREQISKILNDPRSRPTSLFLARFRRSVNGQTSNFEVDYRYSRLTGEDLFEIKGDLKDFLEPIALQLYESDIANNNKCDDKKVFVENAPYFFNNLQGRIYWNGFVMTFDGNVDNKFKILSLKMEPPSLTFDVRGCTRISAHRNSSKFYLNGFMNDDDNASKTFTIKGMKAQDIKKLNVVHPANSLDFTEILPTLPESGIPLAKKELNV